MGKGKNTKIVRGGRNSKAHFGMSNVPIYQTSTIVFPKLEDYFKARKGSNCYYPDMHTQHDLAYGTSGNPTTYAIEAVLGDLLGTEYCILAPSGLSAVVLPFYALLAAGDHVLVTDAVYGNTRRFCNSELSKFGIEVEYYDPLIGAGIKKHIKPNTKMIFTESPASMTYEVQDLRAISAVAKSSGVLVATDNSWASPIYCNPFELGADIVIQALSKYESGNSDVILGAVLTKDKEVYESIYSTKFAQGLIVSAFDVNLVLRGMRSMPARMKMHQENTSKLIAWLETKPEVASIHYPAYHKDPGYSLWKRDFTGANGLISFGLKNTNFEKVAKFINSLQLFSIGASWGGAESIISQFSLEHARTIANYPKDLQFIRISVGLEDIEDLIADLEVGFKFLH